MWITIQVNYADKDANANDNEVSTSSDNHGNILVHTNTNIEKDTISSDNSSNKNYVDVHGHVHGHKYHHMSNTLFPMSRSNTLGIKTQATAPGNEISSQASRNPPRSLHSNQTVTLTTPLSLFQKY